MSTPDGCDQRPAMPQASVGGGEQAAAVRRFLLDVAVHEKHWPRDDVVALLARESDVVGLFNAERLIGAAQILYDRPYPIETAFPGCVPFDTTATCEVTLIAIDAAFRRSALDAGATALDALVKAIYRRCLDRGVAHILTLFEDWTPRLRGARSPLAKSACRWGARLVRNRCARPARQPHHSVRPRHAGERAPLAEGTTRVLEVSLGVKSGRLRPSEEKGRNEGMRRVTTTVFLLVLLVFSACGPRTLRPGEERTVDTSGRKRGWVTDEKPSFHDDDTWYFRGQATGVADLTLGLRQAEADAKKRVVSRIAEQVATEYSEYALGANANEGDKSVFVSDGISWATEGLTVSGVVPAKTYWEKVETGRPHGGTTSYTVYVLVGLPDADYEMARLRAARAIEARARAAADRRAAEAALRLRQTLERLPSE